ncbi:hypothetical protein [Halobacillus massiliensis]|uniref:hypothetical protein n=1 Tax=Halobacillus massiliensis TaxID=1926286 RepID=UPI0009E53CE7|nr:hypothetical protein [Halobacillus massiliensis]
MNDLLELIFSNFLIVAAIIGGLISFFSNAGKKEEQRKQEGRPQNRPQSNTRPSSRQTSERPTSKQPAAGSEMYQENRDDIKRSIQDHYEQRKQEVEERKEAYDYIRSKDRMGKPLEVLKQEEAPKEKLKVNYTENWDRSRLADGIIMSEILGQPRARKPHSSHPRKR